MFSPDKPVQAPTQAPSPEADDPSRQLLRDQSRRAEQELAAVQVANLDKLTLLPNRHGFAVLAGDALQACRDLKCPATLLVFDLDDIYRIVRAYGPDEGEAALKTFADGLRIAFRESDVVGHLEYQRFAVLLTGSERVEKLAIIARLQAILDERTSTQQCVYDICFSIGQIEFEPGKPADVESLLADADKSMRRHV
ncbi:GGDEF domain-containing protein [Pseudomonas sp. NFIX28]|jgi:diguanylate cyclase (GGDEF)-like protein|uniref:GGDEF domain-containing protein n=1 Tax=Pseudomonas sp. NFIX28 TaxID=1566235 RepID=UPI0008961B1B|nr:GGDEF domain-containing protein [Pseudomonas sp. NFIX28]SDZ62960.1 diguanylate cyclase (GGDEF) domain-containing protein [Pseudomonas sp. NFIX28]